MSSWSSKYRIIEKLGEGGFGQVVKVVNKQSGMYFAMKQVEIQNPKSNLTQVHLAKNEQVIGAFISSKFNGKQPPIVKIIETFEEHFDDAVVFTTIMELGTCDLETYIVENTNEHNRKMVVTNVLKTLIDGLKFLHDNGIVHGDIKPENIIVVKNTFKFTDFGLSCKLPCLHKGGTRGYVDPVLKEENLNPTSDIYSFGIMCYNLLTEQDFFKPKTSRVIKRLTHIMSESQFFENFARKYAISTNTDNLGKWKDMIFSMIQPFDPRSRPTIDDIWSYVNYNSNMKFKINWNAQDLSYYKPMTHVIPNHTITSSVLYSRSKVSSNTKSKTTSRSAASPKKDPTSFLISQLKDIIKVNLELVDDIEEVSKEDVRKELLDVAGDHQKHVSKVMQKYDTILKEVMQEL